MASLNSNKYTIPTATGVAVLGLLLVYKRYRSQLVDVDHHPKDAEEAKDEVLTFVGMKNQGATCYLNSLLQTFFYIVPLRKAVYSTEKGESDGTVLALQRVFYHLQYLKQSVSTSGLTNAFGWSSEDTRVQHDVCELSALLCENLAEEMRGTNTDGAIEKLFYGKTKNYIKCLNVDYESSRTEVIHDIQLDVRGCNSVKQSLQKYINPEILRGDNAYEAEGFGLQDAKKGVWLYELPPILMMHLKRFEYNPLSGAMRKINDAYQFPYSLNLEDFVDPQQRGVIDTEYTLFSVLVHSGGCDSGHYFTYINTGIDQGVPKWFKFDDEKVTETDQSIAINGNFGGLASTSAYMLVYIRNSDLKHGLFSRVTRSDIPDTLKKRFDDEIQRENSCVIL